MHRRARSRSPLAPLLIVTLALAAPARAAQNAAPFEALGTKLLAAADDAGGGTPASGTKALERLAPLHERVNLGALELWVPKRTLEDVDKLDDGPRVKDVQPLAVALLELERVWVKRMSFHPTEIAAADAAAARLVGWIKGLKRFDPASADDVVQAQQRIERPLLLVGTKHGLVRPVVLLAPTRAHFLGVLGAVGIAESGERSRLWRDSACQSSGEWIGRRAVLIPLEIAPRAEAPLAGLAFEGEQAKQWVTHLAGHLLTERLLPNATTWWGEALAVCDTIAINKSDETLCTGFAPKSDTPAFVQGNAGTVLVWVTRDTSPFRGAASAGYFTDALRKLQTKTGFTILDLTSERPALDLPGPFLGDGTAVPGQVTSGPTGIKQGYAEFYRAYCAAFVHWLDTRSMGDHTLLAELCRELAQLELDPKSRASPLYQVTKLVTDKTLGSVFEAKLDIEGEFIAYLAR